MMPTKLPKIAKNSLTSLPVPVPGTPHTHVDKEGFLVDCYHSTRSVLGSPSFWIGSITSTVLSFPFEHYLYEKVWPFTLITQALGL